MITAKKCTPLLIIPFYLIAIFSRVFLAFYERIIIINAYGIVKMR